MVLPFKWNLSCSTFTWYYIYLGRSSNFWFCAWNPMVLPFKWNLSCSTFTWYYLFSVKFQLLIPYIALTFRVDELLWCDHSNETFLAVVSHDTIYLLCSTSFWVCGWHPMVWPFKWNHFDRTFTCYMYVFFFFAFSKLKIWKFKSCWILTLVTSGSERVNKRDSVKIHNCSRPNKDCLNKPRAKK